MIDVAIIGCGVIGAAAAFELSKYQASVVILEKENDIAMGATRANSAIIHAGYDPKPGTLMARLNVQGNAMTEQLCRDLDVPFSRIGSFVLAFSAQEAKTVQTLYERGVQNGVPGLQVLSGDEVRQMDPLVSPEVVCALYAPSAGIITPWEYALALAETAVRNGAELRRSTRVTGISKIEGGYRIETNREPVEARYVINAAGVYSDQIHDMVAPHAFTVIPSKGEYYVMDKSECYRARHVLFQCPNEAGKGVLITPTMDHNLLVGPNAENVDEPQHPSNTARGMAFVREKAARTMPSLTYRAAIRNFAGIRANTDIGDFQISIAAEHFIDLAGIKSPGLSSAPAIALEAVKLLKECGFAPEKKEHPVTTRRKKRFRFMSEEERKAAVSENPLYGRVICRCETVTEGEIVDAIHSPIPPCSVDGVKRRAGSGMGRCQGGFCGPRVVDILSRELGISPLCVLQDGEGSFILMEETKKEAQA